MSDEIEKSRGVLAITPEHFWRDVWHDAPCRGPMKHLRDRLTIEDGSVLRLYECTACETRIFAGVDGRNRIACRPSAPATPPAVCPECKGTRQQRAPICRNSFHAPSDEGRGTEDMEATTPFATLGGVCVKCGATPDSFRTHNCPPAAAPHQGEGKDAELYDAVRREIYLLDPKAVAALDALMARLAASQQREQSAVNAWREAEADVARLTRELEEAREQRDGFGKALALLLTKLMGSKEAAERWVESLPDDINPEYVAGAVEQACALPSTPAEGGQG